MNLTKLMGAAIGTFVAVVLLAIGISARFSLSNIISEPYLFIEKFFDQWSPALSAAGTVILAISVFCFIYESRRHEEQEAKQTIYALHDELFWNLNNIITLRLQISERLKYMEEHRVAPSDLAPFELLDTRVFDDMRSRGQLHLLEDMRMNIIPCYKLIRDYNLDRQFKPNHVELLSTLHDWLDKGIRDLERKFRFLPHYIKEKTQNQEAKTESPKIPKKLQANVQRATKLDSLRQFIRKYSLPAFAIVAGIPIGLLFFLAISFSSHLNIKPLLGLGFVFDSLAAATALYVSLFGARRRWYILAIQFFVFGMFFKLFGLL
jgi:hypothetical protein